jgi:hypothetical protein
VSEPWAPALTDVADYIPTRTLDATAPGSGTFLGTFNANTTPTDVQAQRLIDKAVAEVLGVVGATVETALYDLAKTVAALRAAASIERAYPDRDADINTAVELDQRADAALARLLAANSAAGGAAPVAHPAWSFPAPVNWGDVNL